MNKEDEDPSENEGRGKISRREFLTGAGGFAAGVIIGSGGVAYVAPEREAYLCPLCEGNPDTFDDADELREHLLGVHGLLDVMQDIREGWGTYNRPYPGADAVIDVNLAECDGCGECELACSYEHFGVLDRNLSRIQVYKYPTPIYKGVANVCRQCKPEEQDCVEACLAVDEEDPILWWDEDDHVLRLDAERCVGRTCHLCTDACEKDIPIFPPPGKEVDGEEIDYPLICDLCIEDGERRPACVDVCSNDALEYQVKPYDTYLESFNPDEMAELMSARQSRIPDDRTFVGEKYDELLDKLGDY